MNRKKKKKVTLHHPRSRDSQGQETFWTPSADNDTRNYDTECSSHHPPLSISRPKGWSRSKMKWWAIYTNLPVNVIVRLLHPQRRDSQGEETISAPSGDKQTGNYDTQCANHHSSLSMARPKALSRSKMKWWPIYKNLPVDVMVTPPHPPCRDSQGQEMFLVPSADKQTRNYDT